MELILLLQGKVLVWSIILIVGYKGSTGWVRALCYLRSLMHCTCIFHNDAE